MQRQDTALSWKVIKPNLVAYYCSERQISFSFHPLIIHLQIAPTAYHTTPNWFVLNEPLSVWLDLLLFILIYNLLTKAWDEPIDVNKTINYHLPTFKRLRPCFTGYCIVGTGKFWIAYLTDNLSDLLLCQTICQIR